MPFGLAPPWKYPPDVAVYLKGQPQVDIIGRYRMLSALKRGMTSQFAPSVASWGSRGRADPGILGFRLAGPQKEIPVNLTRGEGNIHNVARF